MMRALRSIIAAALVAWSFVGEVVAQAVTTPDTMQAAINAVAWTNTTKAVKGPTFQSLFNQVPAALSGMGVWTNGVFRANDTWLLRGLTPAPVATSGSALDVLLPTTTNGPSNVAALETAICASFDTSGKCVPNNAILPNSSASLNIATITGTGSRQSFIDRIGNGSRTDIYRNNGGLTFFDTSTVSVIGNLSSAGLTVGGTYLNNNGVINGKGLSIVPPVNTIGMSINSPAPTGASVPGIYSFNQIQGAISIPVSGNTGSGVAGCQCLSLLQGTLSIGTGYIGVEAYGASFSVVSSGPTSTISDYVAVSGGVNVNDSTTSRLYGGTFSVTLGSKGITPFAIGQEADLNLNTATGATNRTGFQVVNVGSNRATGIDTAFSLVSNIPGGNFNHVFSIIGSGAQAGLTSTGDFFWSQSTLTLASWANLPNVTVTGNILSFAGMSLSGTGLLSGAGADFNAAAPTVASGHLGFGGTTDVASKCNAGGTLTTVLRCAVVNYGGTPVFIPMFSGA